MPNPNESAKMKQARESLPADLWSIYDQLISEYRLFSKKRVGKVWVNYQISADLVKAGWRPTHSLIRE